MIKQKKSNVKIPVNKMSYLASKSSKNLNEFFQATGKVISKVESNITELSKESKEWIYCSKTGVSVSIIN